MQKGGNLTDVAKNARVDEIAHGVELLEAQVGTTNNKHTTQNSRSDHFAPESQSK